jgi:MFS family permease
MYGRRMILHLSNAFFVIFNLVCAFAPNTTSLIIFRFICEFTLLPERLPDIYTRWFKAGLGGATPIAIGGSVIGDVFTPNERAAAMAVYTMGPLMGPVVGPIAGGFISDTIGFKWIFIIISCFGLLTLVVGVPFLDETYHPVLRARLAERVTGDKKRSQELIEGAHKGLSKTQFLWINLTRPIVLMGKSFILDILSLFMAMCVRFYAPCWLFEHSLDNMDSSISCLRLSLSSFHRFTAFPLEYLDFAIWA